MGKTISFIETTTIAKTTHAMFHPQGYQYEVVVCLAATSVWFFAQSTNKKFSKKRKINTKMILLFIFVLTLSTIPQQLKREKMNQSVLYTTGNVCGNAWMLICETCFSTHFHQPKYFNYVWEKIEIYWQKVIIWSVCTISDEKIIWRMKVFISINLFDWNKTWKFLIHKKGFLA